MWFLILWLHLQFEVFHSHFTHVVSRGRYIALCVGDTNKAQYAVVLEGGGNLTVWAALLNGLHCLATAIGMGSLDMENISKKQKGSYPLIFPIEVQGGL